MNFFALWIFGPKRLALAFGVIGDHCVCRVENCLGGTIILLQTDHLGIGERGFKAQNVFDCRAAEFIDALVVVPHHAKISRFLRQELDQYVLGVVGVLVFIHHYITELFLEMRQHIWLFLKQAHRIIDQIIEIHGTGLFETLLVHLIGLPDGHQPVVITRLPQVFFRTHEAVFGARHGGKHGFIGQYLIVNFHCLQASLHQALGVVAIINCKMGRIAQAVAKLPQKPRAGGMERTGPDVVALFAEHIGQTLFELAGCFIGERNRQNLPRPAGITGHVCPCYRWNLLRFPIQISLQIL